MRAIAIHEWGGREKLELIDAEPVPVPESAVVEAGHLVQRRV